MQIVIFDTEFTAWQGSADRNWSLDWEHREIIQIAAVKVELGQTGAQVVSSFNTLVKPTINPTLSDYIIELTGIEQHVLDEMGVDYPAALQQMYLFSQQGTLPCYSWGNDKQVLIDNCLLNAIDMPQFSADFYNLNTTIRNANIDGAHLCSGELASHLGLDLQGHVHNALYDVRSIALALNYWVDQGLLSEAYFQNNIQPIH
ncbi:MAG: inhibitor of KinA sporulation pathway (predicted exonuclease) [Paraglaciecola sp.]|jgi:inhibitor of KinA sporulation pathway (predicted exonuclease)